MRMSEWSQKETPWVNIYGFYDRSITLHQEGRADSTMPVMSAQLYHPERKRRDMQGTEKRKWDADV